MKFLIFLCYIAHILQRTSAVPPSTTPILREKDAIRTSKTAEIINFVNSMYNGDSLAFLPRGDDLLRKRKDKSERRHFAKSLQHLLGGAYNFPHPDKRHDYEVDGYQQLASNVRYHVIDNPEVLEEYFRKQKRKAERKKRMKKPIYDASVSLDYFEFNSLEKKHKKKSKRRFEEFGDLENLEPVIDSMENTKNPTDMIDQLIPKSDQDVTFQPSFPDEEEEEETTAADDIDLKIREIEKEEGQKEDNTEHDDTHNEPPALGKSTENEPNKEEYPRPQKQQEKDDNINEEVKQSNEDRGKSEREKSPLREDKEENSYRDDYKIKKGSYEERTTPVDKKEESWTKRGIKNQSEIKSLKKLKVVEEQNRTKEDDKVKSG
ncbi:nucleolar protein 58 [Helicoverpa armigera]|uniref:nucleolar protein 58 n=1 Tax=Helicoverpa armigera TaxID=29058 RepID=UPI003082E716